MNNDDKKKVFVILKGDQESDDDEYCLQLRSLGFDAFHCPVLSFSFINLQQLESRLQDVDTFSGLILTSPRTVIAVKKAIKDESGLESLKSKLIFSIGPKTKSILDSELNLTSLQPPSGSSKDLAEFIIQFKHILKDNPLLMPCSKLAKETIQDTLKIESINVNRIDVYQTFSDPNVEYNLGKIIESNPNSQFYFIYFSPSGVKAIDSILDKLSLQKDKINHIAIGPVTNQTLLDRHFKVLTVSDQPNPIAVKEAVKLVLNL